MNPKTTVSVSEKKRASRCFVGSHR